MNNSSRFLSNRAASTLARTTAANGISTPSKLQAIVLIYNQVNLLLYGLESVS
jgi:hypothetical protein